MARNTQVARACNRVIAQISAQIVALTERRRRMERIAKLPFDEAAALTLSSTLDNLADRLKEQNEGSGREIAENARMLEDQARKLSADSKG